MRVEPNSLHPRVQARIPKKVLRRAPEDALQLGGSGDGSGDLPKPQHPESQWLEAQGGRPHEAHNILEKAFMDVKTFQKLCKPLEHMEDSLDKEGPRRFLLAHAL